MLPLFDLSQPSALDTETLENILATLAATFDDPQTSVLVPSSLLALLCEAALRHTPCHASMSSAKAQGEA